MNRFTKIWASAATAVGLWALAGPASALVITYDEIVTGNIPSGSSPWLTASILDITQDSTSGVNITLTPGVSSPEFITRIFFSLDTPYGGSGNLNTSPDLDLLNCNGRAPAGTGPWQLCMTFDPSDKWNDTAGPVSFFLAGLSESNFVSNSAGWLSVAHLQGIASECSAWVGSYNGTGRVAPKNDGHCSTTTPVPEPGTLGLLGLCLLGLGLVKRRTRVAE